MARVYGSLFGITAVVALVSVAVPNSGSHHDEVLGGIAVLCLMLAAAFLVVYRHTPLWVFQVATLVSTTLTAVAIGAGENAAEGGFAVFYVSAVLLAFLFFEYRAAVLQLVFALATYLAVLILNHIPFAADNMLALAAVLGATGAVVGLLRSRLERLAYNLATQANTDPVTSIANRRSFESHFDHELSADEEGQSLSIVICDLDRFKAVNDELGHDQGDVALKLAAETIASSVRSVDIVFRLGGEEFAVLLPNTAALEAYVVAERIRGGVQDAFANHPVPLTVSCGLATRIHPAMDRKALLRAADAALYHAKRNGRNRTVTHDSALDDQGASASSVK